MIYRVLLAIAAMMATPAVAADQSLPPLLAPPSAAGAAPIPAVEYFSPRPIPAWEFDFGARYWYGRAKTGKSLFDVPSFSDAMVSRLTYSGMKASAGELFGRAAFTNG